MKKYRVKVTGEKNEYIDYNKALKMINEIYKTGYQPGAGMTNR